MGLWLNASKSESVLERDDVLVGWSERCEYGPSDLWLVIPQRQTHGAQASNGNSKAKRDESHADDLNWKRGIVSGRVAFVATIH